MEATIIIPTKNEEKAIARVINSIPKKFEVLVVDNSDDKTAEVAKKAGARVMKYEIPGKGSAMVAGIDAAKGSIVAFIDGDGTYPVEKLEELIDIVGKGEADIAVGSRFTGRIEDMTFSHKIGNKIFSLIASLLYGKTTDLLTGMRAMKKSDFKKMQIKSRGFAVETEMFIKSKKLGLKTKEVPIIYTERIGDTKLSGFRDGLKILKTLIKWKFKKI